MQNLAVRNLYCSSGNLVGFYSTFSFSIAEEFRISTASNQKLSKGAKSRRHQQYPTNYKPGTEYQHPCLRQAGRASGILKGSQSPLKRHSKSR
jgi:hypothetical protein